MSEEEQKDAKPNGGRPYILIAEQESGGVTVTGTIMDKVLAYGLLEMARDLIKAHVEEGLKRAIQTPPGGILNFMRNGKRH